jgi:transposase
LANVMTTDAQWAVLDPLLPDPAWLAGRGGRPEAHCRRQVVDAIFYLVDNGIKWGSANRLSALAHGLQTPGRLGSRRPEGFATWDDWRRDIGLPDSELESARTASSIPAVPAPASGFM